MKKTLNIIWCCIFILWMSYSMCLFYYAVHHEWVIPRLIMVVWFSLVGLLFVYALLIRLIR